MRDRDLDLLIYGHAFEKINPDGTREVLDPTTITVYYDAHRKWKTKTA